MEIRRGREYRSRKRKAENGMENIVVVKFNVESEAYQALTELKAVPATENYIVSQAVLAKRSGSHFEQLDGFDTGVQTRDDMLHGGLFGGLLGLLGGPIGMLLMGASGAFIGSVIDLKDAAHNASLLENVLTCITEDNAVMVALVQENTEQAFDRNFEKFGVEITRFDAAETAQEIAYAQKVQEDLAKEAKKKLREEKFAERKQEFEKNVEEYKKKVQDYFTELKNKLSK